MSELKQFKNKELLEFGIIWAKGLKNDIKSGVLDPIDRRGNREYILGTLQNIADVLEDFNKGE